MTKTQLLFGMSLLYIHLFIPFGIVKLPQQSGTASPQNPCFSISLAMPTVPLRLGKPVDVPVTVDNISGKDIYWSYPKTNTLYKAFHIALEKDGQEVETTVFHRKMAGRQQKDDPQEVEDGGSIALPFPSGGSFTWTLDLDKLYHITQPGVYILRLSRFDDCSKSLVVSSPMSMTFPQ